MTKLDPQAVAWRFWCYKKYAKWAAQAFVAAMLAGGVALAQGSGNPTCQANFGPWFDTNASTIYFNGANTQCAYWILTYQVTGFSAISIELDSAVGTSSGPGSFGLFSGTLVSGSNPSTSVSCATVTNCTIVLSGVVGWYQVKFTSHTGSGTIQGTLQGWKTYTALGGNTPSGSGCPGTVGTPCVVDGPTAAGSPPTTAPVLVAGQDGTNVQTVKTDTAGRPQVVGASATGAAVAGNPLLQGWSDGTNAQYAFFCTHQASVTISAGTDTVLVAGTAAKKTIICHLDFSGDSAQTFTIQEGTGSTCGTGTVAVAGAYPTISSFAMDYQPTAALRTATAADDLCLHSGGSVTVGGFVTYAQF